MSNYIDYGCFGPCSVFKNGFNNCGTNSFFKENNGLVPKEIEFKNGSTRDYLNFPLWGNFYSYRSNPSSTTQGFVLGSKGVLTDKNIRLCNENCKNSDNIKPFGVPLTETSCDSGCNINQANIISNSGNIISGGGVILSNNIVSNCNIVGNPKVSNGKFDNEFIFFMGKKDCNITDISCLKDSEMCIINDCANGDSNCVIGNNCNVCESTKPLVCCTSDTYLKEDTTASCKAKEEANTDECSNINAEILCNNNSKCLWLTNEQRDNRKIINVVGTEVSYICSKNSCPSGTTLLSSTGDSICKAVSNKLSDIDNVLKAPEQTTQAPEQTTQAPEQTTQAPTKNPFLVFFDKIAINPLYAILGIAGFIILIISIIIIKNIIKSRTIGKK